MGKDMKKKRNLLSPLQSIWELFRKNPLHGGINLFGKIYGGMFCMGTNDQIMQGGKLKVKRFRRLSQVNFSLIDPDLGYSYIIWTVNTTNRGLNLRNTFCTQCLWGWEFHVKAVLFFKSFYWWPVLRVTYLWARLMEKWDKALNSESEGSWLKPRSNEHQTQWLTLG